VSATIPVTVLAWEGPQARAYLVRMSRAGLRPQRIVLIVRDPWAERRRRPPTRSTWRVHWLARMQDRSHNFHPRTIRKQHPDLVQSISLAMGAFVDDPVAIYADIYDRFSYDAYADDVDRVVANSLKDATLREALRRLVPATVVYTGGGIVPRSVLGLDRLRMIHVHSGLLPDVRGADVLLWSIMTNGRPGVSAFWMVPGLDAGDVLAARELDALRIPVPSAEAIDDQILYRAVYSFIDPLLRAEFLVNEVLARGDPLDLPTSPQNLQVGLTYHFMHPLLRSRALRMLFAIERRPPAATVPERSAADRQRRYFRYYERMRPLAPLRFTLDALRTPSRLRKVSLQNRQKDYRDLQDHPERLALHRDMHRALALQAVEWDSYDYGEGYFYQSSEQLGVTGLRDTTGRVEAFRLRNLVRGRKVLEIGCNAGFLTLALAPETDRIVAFELNPYLVRIARRGAQFLKADNVEFSAVAFEDLEIDEAFDDVISFANHHTVDGNTQQSLVDYFRRCHELTAPGGRLLFESHPPELEGDDFGKTVAIIEQFFAVERSEIHDYGTFLDRNRRFIVATRR